MSHSSPEATDQGSAIGARFRPRLLPLLRQNYGARAALTDILSGITVGLIALPLALALGVASVPAGMATPFPPPAIGIFTAIIGGFVAAALSGSRVQVSGPTAAFVTIVLLIVEKHGYDGLLLATLMAGAPTWKSRAMVGSAVASTVASICSMKIAQATISEMTR